VSALALERLTYAEAARIVREGEPGVKDKSYQRFPIGEEVARFLRAKRLAGCRPLTIDSYESALHKFVLRHADFNSLEPFADRETGPELVLDFLEHYWGEADPATIVHRFAVVASFFEWAYRCDRISADPMRKIERPRVKHRGPRRERIPTGPLHRLVSGQESLRDQAAILLLGRLALRREDLRLLQLADVDLGRDEVYLRHAKGGEEHVLPIGWSDVGETLYLHLQERDGAPDEFFLYPKSDRRRPFSRAGIAAWFVRCCEKAGVFGYTMHQLRHAAADDLYRGTRDKGDAQMLLRHKSIQTTEEYLHRSLVDDLRERIHEAERGRRV
jgi:integrase